MAGRKATAAVKGAGVVKVAKSKGKSVARRGQLELVPVESAPPRKARSAPPPSPRTRASPAEPPEALPLALEAAEAEAEAAQAPPRPVARRRATAEQMAQGQREISVSRVLFQEPPPARLRQPVEGAPHHRQGGGGQLARRLRGGRHPPRHHHRDADLGLEAKAAPSSPGEARFVVVVEDNGPGIVKAAGAEDLRQAPLRLQVPPAEAEPRPAGHRHLRGRACTASSPPASPSS